MKGRLENLLGAFVTTAADDLDRALAQAARRSGSAPAALSFLLRAPGCSIETLRLPLGLSHSAAVRLVDRLVDDGLVVRRSGTDGRTTSLVLTASGRKRALRVQDARALAMGQRTRRLRPTERRQLELILERLLVFAALDRPAAEICRLCDIEACPARRCPVTKQQLAAPAVAVRR